MNTIKILGINITAATKQEFINKILDFLTDSNQHYITTPNPEIILKAIGDDHEYFYILNKADLAIPDGTGLKFAAWAMGKKLKITTGSDLVQELLSNNNIKNKKVGIINWKHGLSNKDDIKKVIQEKYLINNIIIEDIEREGEGVSQDFIDFKPDLLFVTFGAPYQEKFIYHNLKNISSVKAAIGVGGSFDFLTGKIKRSPKIFSSLGIEWLWRLYKQPWRWKRIYHAVIVFPLTFIQWHFIRKFLYRPNAVALILSKNNNILILNWVHGADYWGLPQGGIDSGETAEVAVRREVFEETGLKNINIISKHSNIYKYAWHGDYFHHGYKGQKQTLFILKFNGEESDVKLNPYEHKEYKWVPVDKLISESHPVHEESYKIFLEKLNKN